MGIRTPDLLHAMQALYQLSYSPSRRRPGRLTALNSATPVYKKLGHIRRRVAPWDRPSCAFAADPGRLDQPAG
jgi:hypothetical protein